MLWITPKCIRNAVARAHKLAILAGLLALCLSLAAPTSNSCGLAWCTAIRHWHRKHLVRPPGFQLQVSLGSVLEAVFHPRRATAALCCTRARAAKAPQSVSRRCSRRIARGAGGPALQVVEPQHDLVKRPRVYEGERGEQRRAWSDFRAIYCINLDRRQNRWRFMKKQFDKFGMLVEKWRAVDGNELDLAKLVEDGFLSLQAIGRFLMPDDQKVYGIDLTPGAIGCAMSHMQIWMDIVEIVSHEDFGLDEAYFLVVEDDCRFLPGFSEELLKKRLEEVPEDWEMVYLGGVDAAGRQDELQISPGVRRAYSGFRTTTGYAITGAGAKAALEVTRPLCWQLDTHLTENELAYAVDISYTVSPMAYCLHPPLVEQAKELFTTDVQKDDEEHRQIRQQKKLAQPES